MPDNDYLHDHVDHNLDDPADDHEHHDNRPRYHVDEYHYHHTGDVVDGPVVHLDDRSREHVYVLTDDDLHRARDYTLGFFYDQFNGRPEHVIDKLIAGLLDQFNSGPQDPGDGQR